MRLFFNVFIVIVIGLALGGYSADYSIQRSHGIGAINIGQWSAWPFVGGSEVDPYTAAKVAADGTIPLGAAEGLAFEAAIDQDGDLLSKECRYNLTGITPSARLWTLAAYENDGSYVKPGEAGISSKYSGNIVRFPDGSFTISISNSPQPGNWLSVSGEGTFKLILRLYDTPVTSSSGLIDPIMPTIRRLDCVS